MRTKKRNTKKNKKNGKKKQLPWFETPRTAGQRAADVIAKFGGSWTFIFVFLAFLLVWIWTNAVFLVKKPFDPYPFILLNLALSCLAAFQAPIILMAQNRAAERDRIDAKYDYAVNRKAEREIQQIQKDINSIKRTLQRVPKK